MKIGYACVNLSVPCSCSRTFRLGSFSREKFLETAKNNLDCLARILKWNKAHYIYFFRISSGLIPFADHPVCKIKWQKIFKKDFQEIGDYIRRNKMRVSLHPGHFTIINSPRRGIFQKSLKTLKYQSEILELLGLDYSHKVQIHLGGVYQDKERSKERFIKNYQKLPLPIKKRLVLENDGRSFFLKDCLEVSRRTKIPVLLDAFHHKLFNNGESIRRAMQLAEKTWKKRDGIFMVDFSEQARNKKRGAHSDYLNRKNFQKFLEETRGIKRDLMIEAKKKEKALLKLKIL
jgi:UV DNA damage endonuclease